MYTRTLYSCTMIHAIRMAHQHLGMDLLRTLFRRWLVAEDLGVSQSSTPSVGPSTVIVNVDTPAAPAESASRPVVPTEPAPVVESEVPPCPAVLFDHERYWVIWSCPGAPDLVGIHYGVKASWCKIEELLPGGKLFGSGARLKAFTTGRTAWRAWWIEARGTRLRTAGKPVLHAQ